MYFDDTPKPGGIKETLYMTADEYGNMLNPNPQQLTVQTSNNMDTVTCKEVIIATLKRMGNGKPHSPIRVITQVFEKDGTLIAEKDPIAAEKAPSPETFSLNDLISFAKWCIINGIVTDKITPGDVYKWMNQIKGSEIDSLFGQTVIYREQNFPQ